jgi:beta-phosphoglucomutase-like phosphatase (HAD superfamily)
VERLLREARERGLRLAIATTTSFVNVTSLLAHSLGSDGGEWFEVIGAGDVVPAKKPAPDIYTHVLERLALDPRECMAFEDSGNGLRSALAAGLPTLITVNDYTRSHDFSGALAVLDHFGEPGSPPRVLAGQINGACCVDVEVLRKLHARALTAPR